MIDNYIGLKTLVLLKSVPVGVNLMRCLRTFFLDDICNTIVSKSVTDVTMQQKKVVDERFFITKQIVFRYLCSRKQETKR